MQNDEVLTLEEYLNLVRANPNLVKTAHKRVYDAIIKKGYKTVSAKDDPRLAKILGLKNGDTVTVYNLFENHYGLEREIENIVGYFRAASLGGESSRLFLFLVGPPGSGKSSIVRTLYWALHGEEIYHIDGCPIREEPLNAFPRAYRKELEEKHKIVLSEWADLCPVCRHRLKTEFNSDYTKFRIRKDHISIRAGRYFASVDPTDPISFDKAKLIGSVTLGEKEGDPTAFELDGAYHRANRGLIEFVEVFRNETEFLYSLLEATQSKTIESPAGRTEKIFIDVVIIAHANEPNWKKFEKNDDNEALVDRLVRVDVGNNVRLNEQIEIVKKLTRPTCHLAPQTLETLAMFTILTRIQPSEQVKDLISKVLIYNGDDTEIDAPSAAELRAERPRDGWIGISNRDAAKILEKAIGIRQPGEESCVAPPDLLKVISEFCANAKKPIPVELIETVTDWYAAMIATQFTSIGKDCQDICIRYYENYTAAIIKLLRGETLSPEAENLVNIVESRLPNDDGEKNALRQLIIEQKFSDTSLAIKSGIYDYVAQEVIIPKLDKLIVQGNHEDLNENDRLSLKYFQEHFRALGYCDRCFKTVAEWLINSGLLQ